MLSSECQKIGPWGTNLSGPFEPEKYWQSEIKASNFSSVEKFTTLMGTAAEAFTAKTQIDLGV